MEASPLEGTVSRAYSNVNPFRQIEGDQDLVVEVLTSVSGGDAIRVVAA